MAGGRLVVLLVLAPALLLAACGDGEKSQGDGRTPTSLAATQATADAVVTNLRQLPVLSELADGQALGKPTAKVTLVVFEDFQCPFCLKFTANQEEVIVNEYVKTGKVRYEFKHLVILGDESLRAAVASQCAAQQGRFWELHRKLFLVQAEAGQHTNEKLNVGRFSDANLRAHALEVGVDGAKFDACYRGEDAPALVADQKREALAAGLRGTPGFVVAGTALGTVPANASEWRKILDTALASR